MTTTYTVPDSPSDPAAAALELLVRFPETILHTDAFRPVLQDYAGALDAESAFDGLSWSDAKNVAAAVAFDLTQRDDAQEFIAERARNVLGGDGTMWDDQWAAALRVEHRGNGAGAMSVKDPVRKMRERALRRGLRVIKRGEVYHLNDGEVVVCSGSPGDVDDYLRAHGNTGRVHPLYALPPRWQTAVDDWISWLRLKGMAPQSIRLRYDLVRAMARRLEIAYPAEVTLGDLERYCGSMDWSREHRRAIRTSLVSFFDRCVSHGVAECNPAAGLPTVMQDSPKPRPCPDDLWRKLIETAPPRELLMIRLAGEAGLRRREVARFHSDDLIGHPGNYSLRIIGKGSKLRIVPITDTLADAIRALRTTGFLFPAEDNGHLSVQYVGTMVSDLMPPGWSMQKLRTMYGTRAFRGSKNIRAVQMLLGHASVATTERYVAVDDDEIRAAAVAASVGLFGIGA